MKAKDLFELSDSFSWKSYFSLEVAPWEWLPQIKVALASVDWSKIESILAPPGVEISGPVFIDPSVKLPAFASIEGPAWIGAETEIRPGAFIRGNVIVGENCVLGNSCEYKNCLLLDNVQTPHFNYVGDSILGKGAHLGAGAILANLRMDQENVPVKLPTGIVNSGLRKLGAIMADGSEALCNSVLQPGTILEKKAVVMSGLAFSGHLPASTIAYNKQNIRQLPRR